MRKKGKSQQQTETDHAMTHADEYAGQGGSYEIRDGKRVLVERTEEAKPEKPAGAGSADSE